MRKGERRSEELRRLNKVFKTLSCRGVYGLKNMSERSAELFGTDQQLRRLNC